MSDHPVEPDETEPIEFPIRLQPWVYQLGEVLEGCGVVDRDSFIRAAERSERNRERREREIQAAAKEMKAERRARRGRFFRR